MFLDPGWIILILLDPAVVPQIIGLIPFGGANNYLPVAALLFMIAGEVMTQGRIAEKLIGAGDRVLRIASVPEPLRHDPADVADMLFEPLRDLCRDRASEGARAIALGGGPLAGLARRIAPSCPVPVIHGTQSAIRRMRTLCAGIGASASRSGQPYPFV